MDARLSIGGSLREVLALYAAQASFLVWLALAVTAVSIGVEFSLGETVLAAVIGFGATVAANVLFQGVAVSLVDDLRDGGRSASSGTLIKSVLPVASPLIGAGLLWFAAITVGFVFFVVPGAILLTIWAVIVPVIVLERSGALKAFGRSRALVRGNGWRVFAVILPLTLVVPAVSALVPLLLGTASDPTLAAILIAGLAIALTMPLTALVPAVLYFRLRAIEEQRTPAPEPPETNGFLSSEAG